MAVVQQSIWIMDTLKYQEFLSPPPKPISLLSLKDRILSAPDKWLSEFYEYEDDGKKIATKWNSGTILAVSDGSYKDSWVTYGWIIQVGAAEVMWGAGEVPGSRDNQSSYRSEIMGLLSLVFMLETIKSHYNLNKGKIVIGCDNIEALRMGFEDKKTITPDSTNFDLLSLL